VLSVKVKPLFIDLLLHMEYVDIDDSDVLAGFVVSVYILGWALGPLVCWSKRFYSLLIDDT
jgi:hypothetical protein